MISPRRLLTTALVLLGLPLVLAPQASAASNFDYLLAPATACPGQLSAAGTVKTQTTAMRCLIDYARTRAHRKPLKAAGSLNQSATHKAADIQRCQDFEHTACGRTWDYWISGRRGLLSRWAENIAWGSNVGGLSSPRAIMHSWIYSPHHRENLLNPAYNTKGVGLARGIFHGYPAEVWVQHFGTR